MYVYVYLCTYISLQPLQLLQPFHCHPDGRPQRFTAYAHAPTNTRTHTNSTSIPPTRRRQRFTASPHRASSASETRQPFKLRPCLPVPHPLPPLPLPQDSLHRLCLRCAHVLMSLMFCCHTWLAVTHVWLSRMFCCHACFDTIDIPLLSNMHRTMDISPKHAQRYIYCLHHVILTNYTHAHTCSSSIGGKLIKIYTHTQTHTYSFI